MSNVLLLFIILSIASGFLFFFIKHSKNVDLLPGQKKMVLDLIRELKTSRIDIIFADKSGEKHSATLNLFEARFYLESSKELANDRYNELPLFFSDDPGQVLNFKKFIKRPDFPQEIMDELMDFYNSAYEIVNPAYPYFIIMTDIPGDTEQAESTPDGLFKGNGEAFQSWLSFKECADNLNYVIGQWIKENEKIADSELHAEFL